MPIPPAPTYKPWAEQLPGRRAHTHTQNTPDCDAKKRENSPLQNRLRNGTFHMPASPTGPQDQHNGTPQEPQNKVLHHHHISIPNAIRCVGQATILTSRPTGKKRQGQSPIRPTGMPRELSCKGSLEQSPKRLLTRWHRDASPTMLYTCQAEKEMPKRNLDDRCERTRSQRQGPRSGLSTLSSRSHEDIET